MSRMTTDDIGGQYLAFSLRRKFTSSDTPISIVRSYIAGCFIPSPKITVKNTIHCSNMSIATSHLMM